MQFSRFIKSLWGDVNIKKIILLFIITRLLLLGVGVYARQITPTLYRAYDYSNELAYFGNVGTMFHGWDSGWYLRIASQGYLKVDIKDLGHTETSMAFYPLYPLTIKLVGLVFGNVAAGILISNLCLLASTVVLYLLIKQKWDNDLAYKSAKYLLIFPVSFILAAVQTEPLFLFLLLLVFLFLEKKKFLSAGIAGFLLALTRPIGFLVALPIALFTFKLFSSSNRSPFNMKIRAIIACALPILGIGCFMLYLWSLTGSLSAVVTSEKTWGKEFSLNAVHFYNLIGSNFHSFHYIIDIVFGAVLIFFCLFGILDLGAPYGLIVISIVVVYLTTTSTSWHILSFPRFFSVLFPAYIGMGRMAKESKLFDFSASIMFTILQLVLFFFWTRGFPVPM